MRKPRILALTAAAILVAACQGAGAPSPSPAPSLPTTIGAGEGALSVLAWPGYAEDGSTDAAVNWVKPFEDATGCKTTVQIYGTSDEGFQLFTTNPEQFDVISASGDSSRRLIRGGFVQPVNVEILNTYADIIPALKDKPWNTLDGVHYGIPHGRGPNLLMYRTDQIDPAPTSWESLFDPNHPAAGDFSVYDAPIYIADAAVVLMSTKLDLGIKNPYALDDNQFKAAVDLLKVQRPLVKEYWTDYLKQMDSFRNGNTVMGTSWQLQQSLLEAEEPAVPVKSIAPAAGSTGWSDTWMINSKTKHPNCSYLWLQHITSPEVNIQVAEWFGEAPGNAKACDLSTVAGHCDLYHAADEAYWTNVWYWSTPEETCLDGRTDVKCKGFDAWINAWTEIKG
jgi:putative spermidine/putrescine transport system substrate-binding protein